MKRLHGVGCITPIVKRNRVVCAASACIIVLPSAPALQYIIQVAKSCSTDQKSMMHDLISLERTFAWFLL